MCSVVPPVNAQSVRRRGALSQAQVELRQDAARRFHVDPVVDVAAHFPRPDDPRVVEHLQVVRDGRLRDRDLLGEFRDVIHILAPVGVGKQFQNFQPGRVGKGLELFGQAQVINRRVLAVVLTVLMLRTADALTVSKPFGNHEFYAEFNDPYYIASGFYFSLSHAPAPVMERSGEAAIYRHLLKNTLRPNTFLVELGGYPLQCAGAALRAWAPRYYDKADLGWVHLVQAVTASINFPEPWSISAFLGHTGKFLGPDSAVEGHGHIGLLISYGNWHIRRDVILDDHWVEAEAKLKVDKAGSDRKYATSFRAGVRGHGSYDVKDSWYVSLRRDRTDFVEERLSLVKNTNFELRGDFALAQAQVIALTLEVGKKSPFTTRKRKTVVAGVSLGATCWLNNPHRGVFETDFEKNSVGFIFRPLVHF